MGWEYAQVHLKYTIPFGIVLFAVYRPLLSKLDIFKLAFMITKSPWDSYLIRNRIWTYPPGVVCGLTAWDIPAEELFFFVIQTLNTSLLYMLLSKATLHPVYLNKASTWGKIAGQLLFTSAIIFGWVHVSRGGEGMYMGLILVWACPFLLFLWTISYQFIVNLPWTNTLLPIALPTVYLWVVDTFALRRGTWSITSGTKYGIVLWDGLDIELTIIREAVFFLLTNTLIVFGLIANDNTLAILDTFPEHFPKNKGLPTLGLVVRALLLPQEKYDQERISGLVSAVDLLRKKSRSFYLASGAFEGRLRIDLIRLYAFCRAADDLVDEAPSVDESRASIVKLRQFLNIAYEENEEDISPRLREFVTSNFPKMFHMALLQLPTFYLPKQPLDDLLKGFDTDLLFDRKAGEFPIETTEDLDVYGSRVAGTVAELCNHLILYHTAETISPEVQREVVASGQEMGIALQYVNIARDIKVDAEIDRVYLPLAWLKEASLTPEDVIKAPYGPTIEGLRQKLLDRAFEKYNTAKVAIEKLPSEGKGPIRVAVESYMEIGRVLRETGPVLKKGRATVPKSRRIRVAWSALNQ
uniref:Bifunctional lycopene cyclase/phytoene synthase n=1 Tax=Fusarium scirpi TaxID=2211609 RepID=A0A125RKE7_9HYPO|nr:phytoene synthase [Fusarium scirpi]